jgi:AraC family transcriptional regulator of adaptative response/methylated-DNA-[protein]-cysteine methyltransferase
MQLGDDAFYAAIIRRNPNYDGIFYVGVRTTGVFCRPTCPSRPPKRPHCEFFTDARQAVLASYRPCQRCRPLSHPNETSEIVRHLLAAVEREPDKRWREADFRALSVHASTARRQFRKRFGMTFVQYARARRLALAFTAIRAGERVIAAQLDAGYESGSGFRDAFAKIMGAPPAKGAARALYAAWLDTPLGPMAAVADEQVLYLLEYVDRRGLERQIERLRIRTRSGILPGRTQPIQHIESELVAYFDGRLTRFTTPLARLGSPFQQAVWDVLRTIPVGATRSYGDVARAVGTPLAVRAVARANGANPFAIVVPCHRVVATDGGLAGYGGGLARKRRLLDHERSLARADTAQEGGSRTCSPGANDSSPHAEIRSRRGTAPAAMAALGATSASAPRARQRSS